MSGLYQRPSREEIAARVRGELPGGPPAAPAPQDHLANFGTCLRARMRALGWDQAAIQERAGIKTPQAAARAINGTGVDLGVAARLAALVGLDLAVMLAPYSCATCQGEPPAGYSCLECGAERRSPAPAERLAIATAERTGRTP